MLDAGKSRKRSVALSLLVSGIGIACMAAVLGWDKAVTYRFVWVLVFALLAVSTFYFLALRDKRLRRYFFSFGALFALAQAMGYRLQIADTSGVAGWALCLCIGFCFAPAVAYGCILLTRLLDKVNPHPNERPKRISWISFGVMLLGWLPVFLAYYPGLFTYDVGVQLPQVLNWQFSARHPLLHTLFIGGCYQLGNALGNVNFGIALATVLQMIFMAAVLTRLIRYLYVQNSPRGLWLGTLIVFAVLPVHSILSISMTKDVLFTGFLLLLLIRLHQLSRQPELLKNIRWMAATAALGALACLFRNNAAAAMLVFIPICLLLLPKSYKLRGFALLMSIILLYFGVNTGLKAVLNAHDTYVREYLSIPSQQMARVYTKHPDDEETSTVIKWNVPGADEYIPSIADNTKGTAQVLTHERLVSFLKLWGLVGLKYPMDYIDAFLLTTQGYWWLDDTTYAAKSDNTLEARAGYLSTDLNTDYGVTHVSLFPQLENLYETLFSGNDYQQIPVLGYLLAPAAYIWFILFSLFRGLYQCRREYVMISGLLLCYLLTLLAGPCVLVRYAYPFFVGVPLLLLPRPPAVPEQRNG